MTVETGRHVDVNGAPQQRLAVLHRLLGSILGGAGRLYLSRSNELGALVLIGFMAVIMAIGWLRPVHSWDMIAYLASSMDGAFDSAAALHTHVWEIIRNGVSPDRFAVLSEGDSFRIRQFTDPEAFRSMLPMYEVKLLHIKLVAFLAPIVGPINAGYAINMIAALLFTGTTCWWLLRTGLLHLAPVVVAVLMVSGFPAMAMAETPDFLCAALTMSGILMIDRKVTAAGCAMLVLAVAARPDMLAFLGVLLAAMWFWSDRRIYPVAMAFTVSFMVYIMASKLAHHPGWWPHVYFSTYQFQETLVGFDPDFSLKVYLTGFAWNLIRSAFEDAWLGVYLGMLGGWALIYAGGISFARNRHVLIAAALAAVAAKFIVFPLHDGRVYIPLLLPVALLMMVATRDAARGKISISNSHPKKV